ncbi:hypothetical protein OSB04_010085 [Centaurea solstitialis]|uniref:Uncharacterized protein n=1 Tax=Centaurea solstitialis TaxID=347529 RepID=A0AA38WNZ8_9ASTR|nr:hypothetical protein OSB04_010085 [Centaurea solstitialis]
MVNISYSNDRGLRPLYLMRNGNLIMHTWSRICTSICKVDPKKNIEDILCFVLKMIDMRFSQLGCVWYANRTGQDKIEHDKTKQDRCPAFVYKLSLDVGRRRTLPEMEAEVAGGSSRRSPDIAEEGGGGRRR